MGGTMSMWLLLNDGVICGRWRCQSQLTGIPFRFDASMLPRHADAPLLEALNSMAESTVLSSNNLRHREYKYTKLKISF